MATAADPRAERDAELQELRQANCRLSLEMLQLREILVQLQRQQEGLRLAAVEANNQRQAAERRAALAENKVARYARLSPAAAQGGKDE